MGWLRDVMRDMRSPHRSFGAVARAAVAHPSWPKESKAQPRSLASLLSKLDRGIELQWLADRPVVQQVLAEVLGAPRSRIGDAAGAALAQSADFQRRLRLDDLPFASPLDLTEEPLPPGIPEIIGNPAAWTHLWWVAPSGSGRSLAGAFLAARKRATCVVRPALSSVAELPDDRPLFVELWSSDGPRSLSPGSMGLCVAAPFAPNGPESAGWTVVRSPPPAEFIRPLVRWAALRLPRDGHFVPASAEEWLESAAARGELDGLGTAIGFIGLMDLYGVSELARRGVAKIAARFVADRFAELRREGALDSAWLTDSGLQVLRDLAQRLLTESRTAWEEPRPLDDWHGLVPEEYRGTVDSEWVRASLAKTGKPPTVTELERALETLPPGSFRIVRALEQAGLLRGKHGSDSLALSPRWLAMHLVESARASIAEGVPAEWSEALLAAHAAGPTARALAARVGTGDFSVLEDAIEGADDREPAAVAAVEMAFRIAGLATLSGQEIPDDLALALWDQQMAFVVDLADGPHPRVGYSQAVTEDEPLLDTGAFRLAALALSEALSRTAGRRHPVLRPWLDPRHPLAELFLDSIWAVVRRKDPFETAWAREAYALAHRLRAASGSAGCVPHPLFFPHDVLAALSRQELDYRDVAAAPLEAFSALFAVAAHEGVGQRAVATAVWDAWCENPEPLHDESPLSPSGPHFRRFYSSAPPRALELLFSRGLVTREKVPYPLLEEAAWRGVIASRPDAVSGVPAAWASMPPAVLREALRTTTPTADDLRGAWARAPEIVMSAVDDAIDREDPLAGNLLSAAPKERTAEIVGRLSERLLGATWLRRAHTNETRRWLVERIAERSDGWREAFAFLTELG